MRAYNFGAKGGQPHQTIPGDVPRGRHDEVGTILGGLPRLEYGRAKPVEIWCDFAQLHTSIANISGRDVDVVQ